MSRRDWYLATNGVVLAWIVAALVAVGVHRFVDQPLWLLVHVPLLGAATAAILIWSQHFADTLLRRPASGGRLGLGVRLGLHTLGAAMVVAGMLLAATPLVVRRRLVVAVAVLAHGVIIGCRPAQRCRPASGRSPATTSRRAPSSCSASVQGCHPRAAYPSLADRLVTAHLVLNAYGWIGLTVLGTLVLLWPTVLHARIPPTADAAARRALPVLVAGILIAAAGPALRRAGAVAVGMAVWLGGAALLAVEGWREARTMPPATFAGWSLAAGSRGWSPPPSCSAFRRCSRRTGRRCARLPVMLGPLVVGFAVQVLTGALSYLLPVVALGSPAAAKAGAEVLDSGAAFRVTAFNGALLLYLLPMPSLARVLLSFVAVGVVVAFLVLAIRAVVVGRRVRRSRAPTPIGRDG